MDAIGFVEGVKVSILSTWGPLLIAIVILTTSPCKMPKNRAKTKA